MEGMLGSIIVFAGNFAPRNWMFCSGQTLSIQSNTALYSLLGTIYGGNGTTTFQLPNLNGRVIVGAGTQPAPPLTQYYQLGQMAGTENVTLSTANLPAHTHANTLAIQPSTVNINVQIPSVSNSDANTAKPNNTAVPGKITGTSLYSNATPDGTMKPFTASGSVTPTVAINNAITGNGTPFDNHQPLLAINYIICVMGYYPSRN